MFLGVEKDTGQVYEGGSAPQFAVFPRPAISLAKLIESPEDWNSLPADISHTPFPWVFREDSFDPVTRVRRGRLYQSYDDCQPHEWPVTAQQFDAEAMRAFAASRQLKKRLYSYRPCQTITTRSDCGQGVLLALGSGRATSGWRIIQVETLVDGDIMVTLKAMSAFGVLPQLDLTKIDEENRHPVRQAIERVLDSAFRESPISVIDHCRNAAQVVLSRWMVQKGEASTVLQRDLGEICKVVVRDPYEKFAARDAANIIRLLHTRGKANQQETNGLRVSIEEDGEISIQALAFILREVGWATS